MKQIVFFIIAVFLYNTGRTQGPWTLEQCIEHAIQHNLDLKIQQNFNEKARYNREQSQLNLLPSLNGWGNSSFDFRRSTNQNNEISSGPSYNTSYGISSSIKLFAGFTNLNAIAANRFNELAVEESSKQTVNQLIIAINQLFVQLLYQEELLSVVQEQLKIALLEKDRVIAHIEAGLLERVSLYEIESAVSENQLLLSRTESELKLIKLKLLHLLELPENTNFEVAPGLMGATLPIENQQTSEDIYQLACQNYPSIREKEFQLSSFRKWLSISKGNLAPSLSLSAGYSSSFFSTDTLANGQQTPIGAQFENYLNPSVGLSLSIPIFNARSRYLNVKRSRIDLENAMFALENQKKLIRREIEEAILRLESFRIEYLSTQSHLAFTEKSFETYRDKFRVGLIQTTDFMNAQNQLTQAKTNLLLAKYSWIVQEQTLQLYKGLSKPIINSK
jgi:outer membrane protein